MENKELSIDDFEQLQVEPERSPIKTLNLNQDETVLSVVYEKEIKLINLHKFRHDNHKFNYQIGIARHLYFSGVLGFVSESQKEFYIYDISRKEISRKLESEFPILNFLFTLEYIVLIHRYCIKVYNLQNFGLIRTYLTSDNEHGIAYLHHNTKILITLTQTDGEILLTRLSVKNNSISIKAHDNKIHLIRMDPIGNYIATCSKRGTIIRIFKVENGELYREFRRGTIPTEIFDIKFDLQQKFLYTISSSGTFHVFKIEGSGNRTSYLSDIDYSYLSLTLTVNFSCIRVLSQTQIQIFDIKGQIYQLKIDLIDSNITLESERSIESKI